MNTEGETTINDRIEKIINHYNLNNTTFGESIGLRGSTITNIVSGRKSKPSYEVLRKIAAHFPVNTDWLLLGRGPMFPDTEDHLDRDEIEVAKIVNAIIQSPEKFEKSPMFAKYLENEHHKAIVKHYDKLMMRSNISGIDFSNMKPDPETD
ncbi:MAG: helix-turn-helix domain-containing protein [Bacteroidota bacterium]